MTKENVPGWVVVEHADITNDEVGFDYPPLQSVALLEDHDDGLLVECLNSCLGCFCSCFYSSE